MKTRLELRDELEYRKLKEVFEKLSIPIDIEPGYNWRSIDQQAKDLGYQIICHTRRDGIRLEIRQIVHNEVYEIDKSLLGASNAENS